MAFVDESRVNIKAGDGGKGCESFYRDKYSRHPVPDGADGGKGGDVIFIADKKIHTLLDYRFKQHYEGTRGSHGSSNGKRGRSGADIILKVPVGTIIRDDTTKLLIRDLVHDGESVIVAKGGSGGRGNSKNRTPAPPGVGEQKVISLQLKLIADVGIIGFPNAGKSTLISQVSKVKSKIANYPFTTKQPILGVVDREGCHFIIADLPGLIEGAHEGKGLGDRFLKHVERTKILIQLIDMGGSDGRDPLDDYEKIKKELLQYSEELFHKQRILVANKMDIPQAQKHLKRFKRKYPDEILEVSAIENQGLEVLLDRICEILKAIE